MRHSEVKVERWDTVETMQTIGVQLVERGNVTTMRISRV